MFKCPHMINGTDLRRSPQRQSAKNTYQIGISKQKGTRIEGWLTPGCGNDKLRGVEIPQPLPEEEEEKASSSSSKADEEEEEEEESQKKSVQKQIFGFCTDKYLYQ